MDIITVIVSVVIGNILTFVLVIGIILSMNSLANKKDALIARKKAEIKFYK